MADNGIYSDGFADGRHDVLDEIAEIFHNYSDEPEALIQDLRLFLISEDAL